MNFGKKSTFTLCFGALLLISIFMIAYSVDQGTSDRTEILAPRLGEPQANQENLTIIVVPDYTFFNLNVEEEVNATVTAFFQNFTSAEFLSSFAPIYVNISATLSNGSSVPLPVSVISGTFGTSYAYYFTVPANSTLFAAMTGTQQAVSFLWRQVTNIPYLETSGLPSNTTYSASIFVPSGSLISQAYDVNSNPIQLPLPTHITDGDIYAVPSLLYAVVIQSTLFTPFAVVITGLAIAIVALFALGLMARTGITRIYSTALKKINTLWENIVGVVRAATNTLGLKNVMGSLPWRWEKSKVSRNLLVGFIACAILMVSIASLSGPDPKINAYVVAAPSEISQIKSGLQQVGNIGIITPSQDYSDFNVMSSVGQITILISSNYPSAGVGRVADFVVPNLQNVPIVVIDNSSNPNFTEQILAIHPGNIIHIVNAAALNSTEVGKIRILLSTTVRHNFLGLQITDSGFRRILQLEAILSFVLIFLGWAFLGSRISLARSGSSLYQIAFIILTGVFIFVFSEMTYVVTSSALQFPLSLHAVVSGAKTVTAVGALGFGGGSTPRLVSGILGVLAGVALGPADLLFNKKSFALISSIALLLVLNPFELGQFVYQGLLLFVGNVQLGAAYSTSLTVKGFFYGIGLDLGGDASPTYILSAGKMVYFAGLVPLAFINRMGKNTAALALFVAAIMVGDGGVRVGEMTPDKTLIAIMPGLIGGLTIALILLAVAAGEKFIVSRRLPK